MLLLQHQKIMSVYEQSVVMSILLGCEKSTNISHHCARSMTDRHSRKQAELKAKRMEGQGHAIMSSVSNPIAGLKIKYLSARKLFEGAVDNYRLAGRCR